MKDYNTTNKSFLWMATMLFNNGVKNNDFMLELKDERLLGVDPYDPTIGQNIKMKIKEECANNIWYFFREVLRISEVQGSIAGMEDCYRPFCLNYGSLCKIYLHENNVEFSWTTHLRQIGTTVTILSIFLYDLIFYNKTCTLIGRTNHMKKVLKEIGGSLPEYILSDTRLTEILDSVQLCSVDTYNKINMGDLAKSLTSDLCFIDDAEFIRGVDMLFSHRRFCTYEKPHCQTYFASVISDNAEDNGVFGVLGSSETFEFEMFDEDLLWDIYQIRVGTKELGMTKSDVEQLKSLLNYNEDYIRSEILLRRKRKRVDNNHGYMGTR